MFTKITHKNYLKAGFALKRLNPSTKLPLAKRINDEGVFDDRIDEFMEDSQYLIEPMPLENTEMGLLIIDVDVKNGADGVHQARQLSKIIGYDIEANKHVVSPSGGYHTYVMIDKPISALQKEYSDIDFQSFRIDGKCPAYCVAGRTEFEDGKRYIAVRKVTEIDYVDMSKVPDISYIGEKESTSVVIEEMRDSNNELLEDFIDESTALACLASIDSNIDYGEWTKIGSILKFYTETEKAFDLWNEWSSSADTYDEKEMLKKFETFVDGGAKGQTLVYMAMEQLSDELMLRIRKGEWKDLDGLRDLFEEYSEKEISFHTTSKVGVCAKISGKLREAIRQSNVKDCVKFAKGGSWTATYNRLVSNGLSPLEIVASDFDFKKTEHEAFDEKEMREWLRNYVLRDRRFCDLTVNNSLGGLSVIDVFGNGRRISMYSALSYDNDFKLAHNFMKKLAPEKFKKKMLSTMKDYRATLSYILAEHEIDFQVIIPILSGTVNDPFNHDLRLVPFTEDNGLVREDFYVSRNLYTTELDLIHDVDKDEEKAFDDVYKYFTSVWHKQDMDNLFQQVLFLHSNKGERLRYASMWISGQGTGKSTMSQVMMNIFGGNSAPISGRTFEIDDWNGSYVSKRLVVVEETAFQFKATYEGKIKPLIDNAKVTRREKNEKTTVIDSALAFLFLTNSVGGIPTSEGDRRISRIKSSHNHNTIKKTFEKEFLDSAFSTLDILAKDKEMSLKFFGYLADKYTELGANTFNPDVQYVSEHTINCDEEYRIEKVKGYSEISDFFQSKFDEEPNDVMVADMLGLINDQEQDWTGFRITKPMFERFLREHGYVMIGITKNARGRISPMYSKDANSNAIYKYKSRHGML